MEILVVTWNYPPRQGGMEQLLASICTGLSQHHLVSVITAYADKEIDSDGPMVFRPSVPGLIPYFFFAVYKGCVLLRGNVGIQVIFGGSVLVTPVVVLLAWLFRRKAIIQAHGLDLIHRNWLYQCCVVRCLRYADRVIANSRHTAKLATHKGVAESAIEVVPPGVDVQRFQFAESADALKRQLGLPNRKIILFVGRLARRKGVKEFIDHCLAQIVQRVPEACFIVAGDNPSESLVHHDDVAGAIRQAVANQNLSEHVRCMGAVSDRELVQLYALCDMLVLPVLDLNSDVEGFGMVALEAAAAGKPVIATRCGGVPDAIEDGVTGILVAPGDYLTMSRTIVQLLNDDRRSKTLGKSARQRAQANFSWETIAARYAKLFHECAM